MTLGRQMRHLQREENQEGGGGTWRWQEINKGKWRQQIKGPSEEDEKGKKINVCMGVSGRLTETQQICPGVTL